MSNVIYPDCQDKYNWEQQGNEEKDRDTQAESWWAGLLLEKPQHSHSAWI